MQLLLKLLEPQEFLYGVFLLGLIYLCFYIAGENIIKSIKSKTKPKTNIFTRYTNIELEILLSELISLAKHHPTFNYICHTISKLKEDRPDDLDYDILRYFILSNRPTDKLHTTFYELKHKNTLIWFNTNKDGYLMRKAFIHYLIALTINELKTRNNN